MDEHDAHVAKKKVEYELLMSELMRQYPLLNREEIENIHYEIQEFKDHYYSDGIR